MNQKTERRTVTRSEFDNRLVCPHCGAELQRNPYDYDQKYCPNGCGYAVWRNPL